MLLEVGLRAPTTSTATRHQVIFQAMIRLKEKASPEAVDALTVSEDLAARASSRRRAARRYLHALPTVVPAVGAVARLRPHRQASTRSCAHPARPPARSRHDVAAHRGDAARAGRARRGASLFEVAHEAAPPDLRSLEDVLHDEIDKLEAALRGRRRLTGTPVRLRGPRRAHRRLPARQPDRARRPAVDGQVGARHEHRRERRASTARRPVALFSLEMSETELAQRFIASQARDVEATTCARAASSAEDWPQGAEGGREARAARRSSSTTRRDLTCSSCARRRAGWPAAADGLGLIVVDYLQLMRAGRAAPRTACEQVGQISRGLKILARELEVPVIALSQLSRAVEQRDPTSARCSPTCANRGAIEQDADLVMFIYRDEYYDEESERRAWPR